MALSAREILTRIGRGGADTPQEGWRALADRIEAMIDRKVGDPAAGVRVEESPGWTAVTVPLELSREEARMVDEHPALAVELQQRYGGDGILVEVSGHERAAYLQVPGR